MILDSQNLIGQRRRLFNFIFVIFFVSVILALVAQLSDDAELGHHYILCFSLSSLICAVAQLRLNSLGSGGVSGWGVPR